MNKKIFSVAIAAMALCASTAMAQDNAGNAPEGKCGKEQKCAKGGTCCDRKCAPNPFDGLDLTQQQQEKLKAIAKPEPREAMKAARTEYLKNVKSVLSEKQYVQFLENNFVNQPCGKKEMRRGFPKMMPDNREAPKQQKQQN